MLRFIVAHHFDSTDFELPKCVE